MHFKLSNKKKNSLRFYNNNKEIKKISFVNFVLELEKGLKQFAYGFVCILFI